MARIEGEIVIGQPVDVVFDYVADQSNEPRYNPQMVRAEKITAGPVGKGTRFRSAVASRGRTAEMLIECTGYDRPKLFTTTTAMAQADISYTLRFEPVAAGTRMRWSGQVRPKGVFRLLGPLITWMGIRQEQRIWTSLKQHLEAAPTGRSTLPSSPPPGVTVEADGCRGEEVIEMPVLVVYASKHGATREIAERVAQTMAAAGQQAQARPVTAASDLTGYDAFVVGSAVYMGHWQKEAAEFVRRNRAVLAGRPVWLFSSGPLGTEPADAQGRDLTVAAEPKELAEFTEAIHPRGHRVFFGVLDPGRLGLGERAIRKLPAGRALLPEGDFRDWAQIEAWARDIARDPALGTGGADRTGAGS